MDIKMTDSQSNRFLSFLASQGIQPALVELPTTTHSALDAARAVKSDLSQIVKSLIFTGCESGRAILVLVSGPNKADIQRLSEIVGEKVQLADKQTVLTLSGYPVGAVPPAGLSTPLPTFIDEDLGAHAQVWVSGGTDHSVVALSFNELCSLTKGKVTTVNRSLARPVIIVPYDPQWSAQYDMEKIRIQEAMGAYLEAIEHIGSTAVPGLSAKPIIDILGGIVSLSNAPLFIPKLEQIGYCYVPEYETQLPQRRYLTRLEGGHAAIHLHIVETTSQFWRDHLAFRNLLRSNNHLRDAYGRLKIDLAAKFNTDRVGYTDAKTDFIRKALDQDRS
jgi:GrpB-like predicted nucleotidyltransferase (UPF0157 family)/prolyl-tRNA editing enzyme YbaK/EbsC (Cys-tRNA(Pro) deacylase)